MGHQHSDCLGLRNREFRMVDWNWTCGNVHFGYPAFAASEMAHCYKSSNRGDDAFCCRLRGNVSAVAPGTSVDLLFFASLSGHDGAVATVSQSAGVGRVCGE